jgi:hypothetical protein
VGIPRKVVGRCFGRIRPVGKPRGRWDDGVWICSGDVSESWQQGKQKFVGRRAWEGGGGPWPSNGQKRLEVENEEGF